VRRDHYSVELRLLIGSLNVVHIIDEGIWSTHGIM
jgi:hypothetical protein